jgi:hypothetical protein
MIHNPRFLASGGFPAGSLRGRDAAPARLSVVTRTFSGMETAKPGDLAQTRRAWSADTEILSLRGWLGLDKLRQDDRVATRTGDGRFEWQCPTWVARAPYSGEMVRFHSRTADMLTTVGHPVLHRVRQRKWVNGKLTELPGQERVTSAGDLVGNDHISLIATSIWLSDDAPEKITFLPTPVRADGRRNVGKPPLQFSVSAADFVAFMGMYIAEGYLGPSQAGEYPIYICQSHRGNGFPQYQELLNRILGRPVPWRSPSGGSWCFRNKALYEYLVTCGKYAYGKRIPREVLDLPSELLEVFWHYYWLGDGSLMHSAGRKDIEVNQTTSQTIADGFQEILQKLGGWSIIHRVPRSEKRYGERPLYRVVRRAGDVVFARAERLGYQGMIGAVSVANTGVYVRRNGHPVWAGSS